MRGLVLFVALVAILATVVSAGSAKISSSKCDALTSKWIKNIQDPQLVVTIEQTTVPDSPEDSGPNQARKYYPVFRFRGSSRFTSRYFLYDGDGKWLYAPSWPSSDVVSRRDFSSTTLASKKKFGTLEKIFSPKSPMWNECGHVLLQKLDSTKVRPASAPLGTSSVKTAELTKTWLRSYDRVIAASGINGVSKGTLCVLNNSGSMGTENVLCCRHPRKDEKSQHFPFHCCRTTSGEGSLNDFGVKYQTPSGIYRIAKGRIHDKHALPWYDLHRLDGDDFFKYTKKGFDGRAAFGLHPGQRSEGCVTVQVPRKDEISYELKGTCWSEIDHSLQIGSLMNEEEHGEPHAGYLFVISRYPEHGDLSIPDYFSTRPFKPL